MFRIHNFVRNLPWVGHSRGTLTDAQALVQAQGLLDCSMKKLDKHWEEIVRGDLDNFKKSRAEIFDNLKRWLNQYVAPIKNEYDPKVGYYRYRIASKNAAEVSQLRYVLDGLIQYTDIEQRDVYKRSYLPDKLRSIRLAAENQKAYIELLNQSGVDS